MKKFSLLNHERIPMHEIMAEDEISSVLKQYGIGKEQLPKIKVNDPVIKEINATVGDVVKITRINPTSGKSYYYRLVIE
ncbi:DNA-directed RNA polymerase subunit H [Methanosalsum natronophilum]|uniref:DNA-directed RNA polymerase subunit Rpo5 n=1 Tax=Methanosalsum natronophilum TaxID=768733 RepID=A0A424YV24_9EURY|nr:DNA-directed RNA polymerase subunit H [Methanosalsum natronophilum]MCS3923028.1 DNA-directed RNA polymerase subunit H [Methanosalsum natronophilum]RQD82998.1 MAG: DNA-directed RNA polymerase subunit H [Methanosalsum natronophilum]